MLEPSHCGLCANLNKLGFSPQQNLEIHKKMGMSDEQLEAYEKQEREVCVLIPLVLLLTLLTVSLFSID